MRITKINNKFCSGQKLPKKEIFSQKLLQLKEKLSEIPENSVLFILIHQEIGEILFDSNPWGAILHFKKILQKRPWDEEAHALMGLSHFRLHHFQKAKFHFLRALQVSPDNPSYLHNLGHLLDAALGKPEEGVKYLQKALKKRPGDFEIRESLNQCKQKINENFTNPDHRDLNLTVWANQSIHPLQKLLSIDE